MRGLDGDWRVERTGGLLSPMPGVWKRIHGNRGETRLGLLPGVPFRVEARLAGAALIYRAPFSMIIDELRPTPDGVWLGRTMLYGRELGRFRMQRR